jgi:hypothetical protein
MNDITLENSTHKILEQIIQRTCWNWGMSNSKSELSFFLWAFPMMNVLYCISLVSPRLFEWLMRARMYRGN